MHFFYVTNLRNTSAYIGTYKWQCHFRQHINVIIFGQFSLNALAAKYEFDALASRFYLFIYSFDIWSFDGQNSFLLNKFYIVIVDNDHWMNTHTYISYQYFTLYTSFVSIVWCHDWIESAEWQKSDREKREEERRDSTQNKIKKDCFVVIQNDICFGPDLIAAMMIWYTLYCILLQWNSL